MKMIVARALPSPILSRIQQNFVYNEKTREIASII